MNTRHQLSSRASGRLLGIAVVLLITVGMISTAIGQVTFQTIPVGSIDAAQKALATKVADGTLKAWRAGNPASLADFTQQMKTALPPEKQLSAYQSLASLFGDYQSVTFHEAVKSAQLPGVTVYRFRGSFSKGQPEVRVVIDHTNLVAGFWVKVWSDTIQ